MHMLVGNEVKVYNLAPFLRSLNTHGKTLSMKNNTHAHLTHIARRCDAITESVNIHLGLARNLKVSGWWYELAITQRLLPIRNHHRTYGVRSRANKSIKLPSDVLRTFNIFTTVHRAFVCGIVIIGESLGKSCRRRL